MRFFCNIFLCLQSLFFVLCLLTRLIWFMIWQTVLMGHFLFFLCLLNCRWKMPILSFKLVQASQRLLYVWSQNCDAVSLRSCPWYLTAWTHSIQQFLYTDFEVLALLTALENVTATIAFLDCIFCVIFFFRNSRLSWTYRSWKSIEISWRDNKQQ